MSPSTVMTKPSARRSVSLLPIFLPVLVAASLLTSSCAADRPQGSTPDVVYAAAVDTLPFDSLADWRSYADLVAVVRVRAESRRPDPSGRGDGPHDLRRSVTVVVERTLWSRREIGARRTIEFPTDGWVRWHGRLVVVSPAGDARLEVGRSYVVALTLEGPKRGPMTSSSVLPLVAGRIATRSVRNRAARSLDGLAVDQLDERLAKAAPDPVAERYQDLPPRRRYRKVQEGRDDTATPTTTTTVERRDRRRRTG